MLLSSGDNFPHLIQKRRSQLGFVTYLLNYPRITRAVETIGCAHYSTQSTTSSFTPILEAEFDFVITGIYKLFIVNTMERTVVSVSPHVWYKANTRWRLHMYFSNLTADFFCNDNVNNKPYQLRNPPESYRVSNCRLAGITMWYDKTYGIYLLQLGFHPVTMVGKLVQK